MKTLKQIWEAGTAHYYTPICGSRIYQESEIKEWLTQKRPDNKAEPTYNRFKEKLIINEFITQLLEELNHE